MAILALKTLMLSEFFPMSAANFIRVFSFWIVLLVLNNTKEKQLEFI
jgi:hypothetical protein